MFSMKSGLMIRSAMVVVCLMTGFSHSVVARETGSVQSMQMQADDTAARTTFSKATSAWRERLRQCREAYREKLRERRRERVAASSPPKTPYGKLIAKYAARNGVPTALGAAVVQVESSFRPNVTGGAGEIGLMQIKLSTARGMGFTGTRKQLYEPATNLSWGMKYLGKAYQLAGGSTCGTILLYNAGHYAKRMNPISCDIVAG